LRSKAPKAWNALLTSWLISYGFTHSLVDPGVFVLLVEKPIYILAGYVEDSILPGKARKFFTEFKTGFSGRFEIEDIGPTYWLLGCRIDRVKENMILRLSQAKYISEIIERGVRHGILHTNGSQGSLQAKT